MTYERRSRGRRRRPRRASGLGALAPPGVSILSRQAAAYRAQPEVLAANIAEAKSKGWNVYTDNSGRLVFKRPKTALDTFGLPAIAAATVLAVPGVAPLVGRALTSAASGVKRLVGGGRLTAPKLPGTIFDPVTGMPISTGVPDRGNPVTDFFKDLVRGGTYRTPPILDRPSSSPAPASADSQSFMPGGGGGGAPAMMTDDAGGQAAPTSPGGIPVVLLVGGAAALAFLLSRRKRRA